jgi:ribosomal protein L37E
VCVDAVEGSGRFRVLVHLPIRGSDRFSLVAPVALIHCRDAFVAAHVYDGRGSHSATRSQRPSGPIRCRRECGRGSYRVRKAIGELVSCPICVAPGWPRVSFTVCGSRPVPPGSSPPSLVSPGSPKCSTRQPRRCPGVVKRRGSSPAPDELMTGTDHSERALNCHMGHVSFRGTRNLVVGRGDGWSTRFLACGLGMTPSPYHHDTQAVGVASPEALITYVSNQATVSFHAASACSSFQRGLVSSWNPCSVSG